METTLKKQLARNNEYYDMTNVFDELYEKSKKGIKFKNLVKLMVEESNILLAYRNIKNNKGSNTAGTDNKTLDMYENLETTEFVTLIQNKFKNYKPKSVKRVEIPKPNGDTRPLGIPCIEDRIVQQCIKQILEPIAEAKFHKHSYGFRPNRSTKHAIARTMTLINKGYHYVVDIDIKGFFDNVNHSKLYKQLWAMGIQDKNLICILKKILKSEIQGIGIPEKGTPQGGIISPLLSNIVLNELDWWLSSQWETIISKKVYSKKDKQDRALKESDLKVFYFVRYADDFKILCKDYKTAQKIFNATQKWLIERLGLEISKEKSKVCNLRKNTSEFLGFSLKAEIKGKKYVCQSNMSEKAKKNIRNKLTSQIKIIKKSKNKFREVNKYNSMILGIQNYYKTATNITVDLGEIHFLVTRTLYNRLKDYLEKVKHKTSTYQKLYKDYKAKPYTMAGITIFPIYAQKHVSPMNFTQSICNYTIEGRNQIHKNLKGDVKILIQYVLNNINPDNSLSLIDNQISLIAGQNGKCAITGNPLKIGFMECHHKTPKSMGGSDEYKNIMWVNADIHKLIHATKQETINYYLNKTEIKQDKSLMKKLNSSRVLVGNLVI